MIHRLNTQQCLQDLLETIKQRDPDQPEFLQAVDEVLHTVTPVLAKHPQHFETIKRLVEPERTIIFRVPWCGPRCFCPVQTSRTCAHPTDHLIRLSRYEGARL